MGHIERTGVTLEATINTGTIDPGEPPETITWEVTGTISKIPTNGFFFLTTAEGERVFVATELLAGTLKPHENDWLRCRVFRNEHGLRAEAVLEYRTGT